MTRLLVLSLVLALSGAPLAALFCDVLLCLEAAAAPRATSSGDSSAGCHEHVAPFAGVQVNAASDECRHLASVDPFMASAARFVPGDSTAVAFVAAAVPARAQRGRLSRKRGHGPPQTLGAHSFCPLRI